MQQELSLVAQWNEVMLEAIRTDGASPTPTTYHLHQTTTAVYDAWAAYDVEAYGHYTDIIRPAIEHTDANKAIAVSYAFYDMLLEFFPEQQALFDGFMSKLGYDPAATGAGVTDPITVAKMAVQGVRDTRDTDGTNYANDFADTSGYVPVNDPQEGTSGAPGGADFDANHWQPMRVPTGTLLDENGNPTYDDNDPSTFDDQVALTPHWGSVKGFGLDSVGQVRPEAPPKLGDFTPYTDALGKVTTNDQAYRDQFTEVLNAGAALTTEHKVIAEYWADGPRSEAPPGHWNQIAQDISLREGHGIDDDAKMFFALNAALYDAGIATWEAKYHYDFLRPQSAIRDMFYDQEVQSWGGPNQGTQSFLGKEWQPYQDTTFVTPPFPEYTSGHSSFSFAAAKTIAAFVGSDAFFDGTSMSNYNLDSMPGTDLLGQYVSTKLAFEEFTGDPVTLQWATLTEAAAEAGLSRIYGGIHIQDGDYNSRKIGEDVAALGKNKWDALFKYAGDNVIEGSEEDDMLYAGTGDDVVNGGAGNDLISGGAGADKLSGGAGADIFRDKLKDLFGDVITDFEQGVDSVVIQGKVINQSDISVRKGSAILGVDADQNGTVDAAEEFTLAGSFTNGKFMAMADGSDTVITFEHLMPELKDLQGIDIASANGVINNGFFAGNGVRDYKFSLNDSGTAAFENVLGMYEVDADGNLVNAQILLSDGAAQVTEKVVENVADGHKMGFFLVQNGAAWAAGLTADDTISFVNGSGDVAKLTDGNTIVLAVNGAASGETVFHSIDATLNQDGLQHAVSGVDKNGNSISIGFEDMTGGGDRDFQDFVFSVEAADSFVM